ncbi:hypothetical protein EUGRSUZ_I02777 [Eucalyptus grandis]|uniref:Uncharacterized protein n=2 Tax=Eucalyptus grandis TaxID=71139 RepID=A0ACC3JK16_EUCGR|nr:hypothetical protein EUGRSUZ_I02777 [Eucalyptus grandis]
MSTNGRTSIHSSIHHQSRKCFDTLTFAAAAAAAASSASASQLLDSPHYPPPKSTLANPGRLLSDPI